MGSRITMQRIAEEFNTSKVTVSRALNNKSGMSEELRSKIIAYAGKTGYYVNQEKQINSLAFIVPVRFFLEYDRFYSVIHLHLNDLCQTQNRTLTVITVDYEQEQAGELPEPFFRKQFDGIFLVGECGERFVETVTRFNLPMVLIDFARLDTKSNCIMADNFELGYKAADFLIQNGHQKIGFVGDLRNRNYCDRYLGLQKALYMRKLDPNPEYNIVTDDLQTGLPMMNFTMPEKFPTAFVCSCDMLAFYLYEKLKAMNYRVPEDISIISFDNTEICNKMTPPLTSVEINKSDFALMAYQLMHEVALDHPSNPQKLFVDAEIVIRDSVKHIKNA